MVSGKGTFGILVGGGPAPGINGVIHSATIEAINNGFNVIGIYDGFKHLIDGHLEGKALEIKDVSRIHLEGGSILRISRANPTRSSDALRACVNQLLAARISHLISIGGDDTAYAVSRVVRYAQEEMGVTIKSAHVPKTIDNDLPLPEGIPTFGYETAREVGTRIVMNFMTDAKTSQHWFIVVTMGRKAGHLALGIGKSSGATVTLIPEEWGGRQICLQEVVDIIATSIIRRLSEGRAYGVALVAEGIMEQMSFEELQRLADIEHDEFGHVRLGQINFSDILKHQLHEDLETLGVSMKLVNKELGYELRCAAPIAYDIDYTRSLGEAAVDYLLAGGNNAIITLQQHRAVPIPYQEMIDPVTGRTGVRMVDVNSFVYKSAQKFMIRMKAQDAGDQLLWAQMAAQTNLSLEKFKQRYGYLVGNEPRPF